MKISQTKDYELIARLNKHVHDVHSQLFPKYFKEYEYEQMKEAFRSFVQNENFIFLLLEDQEEEIGYAWIEIRQYPENAFTKSYQSVFVHNFSINSMKRNQGYGSQLMDEIYQIAKSNGIDLIQLDYWYENTIAKDFYQKQGFQVYRQFVYKDLSGERS